MNPRVAMAVVATNRPEYLVQTLHSQRLLDWSGFDVVERILIDDYPQGRDDEVLQSIAHGFGYHNVFLHHENWGIGRTWQQLWDHLKARGDVDYIWHQEDDAIILAPVKVAEMLPFLQDPKVSVAILARLACFDGEEDLTALDTDIVSGSLRGSWRQQNYFFNPMASFYPMWCAQVDYQAWYREHYAHEPVFHHANVNEALVGKVMLEGYGRSSLYVKDSKGAALLKHIGQYTVGKKVLPGEPGYATWSHLDPTKRYHTNTCIPYQKGGSR